MSKFIFDKEEMFRLFNDLIPDSETQEGTLVFKYKSTEEEAAVFLKVGNQQRQLEKVVLKTFKSIH